MELQTAIHCLFSKFKHVERAATAGEKVEFLTLNTPERVAGYRQYPKAMDGKLLLQRASPVKRWGVDDIVAINPLYLGQEPTEEKDPANEQSQPQRQRHDHQQHDH